MNYSFLNVFSKDTTHTKKICIKNKNEFHMGTMLIVHKIRLKYLFYKV